jgi:hypothetical protein
MDLTWLFKKNDKKSNVVKAIVVPETENYQSTEEKPVAQDVGFNVDNVEVVHKSLSEAIDKGYDILGRAETKRVLKRLLEKMEEEDKKNA